MSDRHDVLHVQLRERLRILLEANLHQIGHFYNLLKPGFGLNILQVK